MKKSFIIAGGLAIVVGVVSCTTDSSKPGRAYAPDMVYSVAYETYAPSKERLAKSGANYTHMPVEGTVARGDSLTYFLKNDSAGYARSAFVKNPLSADEIDLKEGERLYLIQCGICHGDKLDGNGPLFKGGDGPYKAAPKDFTQQDMKDLPEGTFFHSITYGKGMMGSYASQLTPKQRWEVIAYIKSKQFPKETKTADAAPATDSVSAN